MQTVKLKIRSNSVCLYINTSLSYFSFYLDCADKQVDLELHRLAYDTWHV